jgi:hypothetical protein
LLHTLLSQHATFSVERNKRKKTFPRSCFHFTSKEAKTKDLHFGDSYSSGLVVSEGKDLIVKGRCHFGTLLVPLRA